MKVVAFIEPPLADVIEEIVKHCGFGNNGFGNCGFGNCGFGNCGFGNCGLWQSRSPRAPPVVDEWVLELDAAYSGNSLDTPVEADESQELTYVDIGTFLASF